MWQTRDFGSCPVWGGRPLSQCCKGAGQGSVGWPCRDKVGATFALLVLGRGKAMAAHNHSLHLRKAAAGQCLLGDVSTSGLPKLIYDLLSFFWAYCGQPSAAQPACNASSGLPWGRSLHHQPTGSRAAYSTASGLSAGSAATAPSGGSQRAQVQEGATKAQLRSTASMGDELPAGEP